MAAKCRKKDHPAGTPRCVGLQPELVFPLRNERAERDSMADISRRRLLAATAAAALVPIVARAQEEFTFDGILPFIWDAHVVRDLVIVPELGEEQTMYYVGRDFHSRTGLVTAAHLMGAFETRAQAARYLDGLTQLADTQFGPEALASQMQVIEALLRTNLPLIPRTGSVQPVRLALVEPTPFIPPGDRDILIRIVADTLEIVPDDLPDEQTLDGSAEIVGLLDAMLELTREQEWSALTDAAEMLLADSASGSRLAAIREEARPRVLYNLAVSCVPLIGWTFMSARLVAGIRRNSHRFSFA
jgi:hypothetical protein